MKPLVLPLAAIGIRPDAKPSDVLRIDRTGFGYLQREEFEFGRAEDLKLHSGGSWEDTQYSFSRKQSDLL